MEIGWAKRYGVYPGDRITIAVGEQQREFSVTSVRKADWNTFRPNFFVLLNPNAVGDTPHNLLSAFHLPAGRSAGLGALVLERGRDAVALDRGERRESRVQRCRLEVELQGIEASADAHEHEEEQEGRGRTAL